jgi:hypothetical protein
MLIARSNDSPEASQVPRLSMIVPFQRDEVALETSLLSALESRSDGDELIIVHSGDYSDPHHLGADEAILLQTEPSLGLAEQLNLAVAKARSPIVQILMPGTVVEPDWAEEAVDMMHDASVHAISLPLIDTVSQESTFGLDAKELPHRRMARQATACGGPILAGSMIRRRSLLKMGGWNASIPRELIDVELSLLMGVLELGMAVVSEPVLTTTQRSLVQSVPSFDIGKGCGMLACAFGEIPDSGIAVEPLVKRLGHLATGLMNPKLAAERLGWVMGVRDRSFVKRLSERVERARAEFSASSTLPMPSVDRERRRAA